MIATDIVRAVSETDNSSKLTECMKASLTSLARQVILLQTNVNVRKAKMTFRADKFSEAEFEFDWAGYSGGNKLGFKMDFKK